MILFWVVAFSVWIALARFPTWRLLLVLALCLAPFVVWVFLIATGDHAGMAKLLALALFIFTFVIGALVVQTTKELRAGVFWSGLKETAAAFFARRPVIGDEKEATASGNQTSTRN